jgi:hypothetical protein
VDLSAVEEDALFNERVLHLLENSRNWADHHHLAGTTAEVNAGKRGNYTALVSPVDLLPLVVARTIISPSVITAGDLRPVAPDDKAPPSAAPADAPLDASEEG